MLDMENKLKEGKERKKQKRREKEEYLFFFKKRNGRFYPTRGSHFPFHLNPGGMLH